MFCFFAPFLRSVESSSNVENGIRRHSLASSLSLTISSCHLFCSLSLFIVVLSVSLSLSLFIVISRCLQFLFIFFVQVGSKCVLFTFTLFGVSSSASSVFLSFVFHNDTFLLFAYYETSSSVFLSFFLSFFHCLDVTFLSLSTLLFLHVFVTSSMTLFHSILSSFCGKEICNTIQHFTFFSSVTAAAAAKAQY